MREDMQQHAIARKACMARLPQRNVWLSSSQSHRCVASLEDADARLRLR